jgi:TonB-dependent receptor
MTQNKFNLSKLATSLSLILGASISSAVFAAETQVEKEIEVIEVRGMRGSLIKAVDIKRSANGVVDAITAEDIGKFPDGNLAESLQRISGVSIDRSNGEGAKITVRGMGPEFNMVTLNGRQMPSVAGDTATAIGRGFDFGNVATDAVSAVEVYKTARADLPTGGIGATVNMMTARPLSSTGQKAVLSAKSVHETSNENGKDFTPEISGLYSNTFADDTFGVLVSGSYQERDNQEQNAAVDNWIPNVGTGTGEITDNNQRADGSTWYPQNAGYGIKDTSRERTNAQVVVQYQATETLRATLDYTYSKVASDSDFNSFGVWFNNGGSITSATVNERGTYTSVAESGGDFATNVGRGGFENENKSLGFNLEWEASETLSFEFDIHDSSAVSQGTGLGTDAFLIIGNTSCGWCGDVEGAGPSTANIDIKTAIFPNGGIPIYDMSFIDGAGNAQDSLNPSDIGSLFGGVTDSYNENEMNQFQFKGTWLNGSDGALSSIQFGFARTEQDTQDLNAYSGLLPAGFWNWSAQYWDDEQWQQTSTGGLLDGFGNNGDIPIDAFYNADFDYLVNSFETIEDTFASCCFNESWDDKFKNSDGSGRFWSGLQDSDARVNEVVTSVYAQLTFEDEFNEMPINIVTGLRYEEAKVTSTGLETPALDIIWSGGNEFAYITSPDQSTSQGKATTKQFLPSLDVSLEVTDDLVTRFSYARSLSRPKLGSMRSTRDFPGNPKIGQRKIVSGNPSLSPYIADNFDLSMEYYYDEGSYASIGYFKKVVDNFLIDSTSETIVAGIRDVYNGPRAEEARAQLVAEGIQATDPNVFARINLNMGLDDLTAAIAPNGDDPLAIFDTTTTANGETANLHGWELAVQHLFGQSGFGIMVNATMVSGDVEADRDAIEQEFALPGMSDSANFSVFYENEQLSTRISYNWRDEFFSGFDQHGSPVYTEEYSQLDANISYNVNESFTVFAEALNITEEVQRSYVRYSEQLNRANQYGARFNLGARYVF